MEYEIIAHYGEPKDCPVCKISTRPICKSCGHALSGQFTRSVFSVEIGENIGYIVCEVCGEDNLANIGF